MNTNYPGKILIIDDDQDIRNIYGDFLTGEGFKIDFAVDGKDGLEKIQQGGYDLILLDIMLPKMDGLSILKHLKQFPVHVYNGPIIMLSALDQEQIVKNAADLGAKGYLQKSNFNPKQALEKIYEFLQQKNN